MLPLPEVFALKYEANHNPNEESSNVKISGASNRLVKEINKDLGELKSLDLRELTEVLFLGAPTGLLDASLFSACLLPTCSV